MAISSNQEESRDLYMNLYQKVACIGIYLRMKYKTRNAHDAINSTTNKKPFIISLKGFLFVLLFMRRYTPMHATF